MFRKRLRLAWIVACLTGWAGVSGNAVAQDRSTPDGFRKAVRRIEPALVNVTGVRLLRTRYPLNAYRDPNIRRMLARRLRGLPNRPFAQRSLGSGVIVDARGYVLTNEHLVFMASEIRVKLTDGREYPAEVVGTDAATDLAVLKLPGRETWPAASLGDSDRVQVGDWVLSAGSPFGLERSVSVGIVSAKNRLLGKDVFFQTDAILNPGSSGGPLVDDTGRVIGITSAILDKSGVAVGVSFAVPSNTAARVLHDILETGVVRRGWLGAVVQPLTPELAGHFRTAPDGVLVGFVAPGGPAAQAGLAPGDIILRVSDTKTDSPARLLQTITETVPGSRVQVIFRRDGQARGAVLTVGGQAEAQRRRPRAAARRQPLPTLLGFQAEALTPEAGMQLVTGDLGGVVTTSVEPCRIADRSGLAAGDIIRELDRRPVRSPEDYRKLRSRLKPGMELLALIERNGYTIFVTLRVPEFSGRPAAPEPGKK